MRRKSEAGFTLVEVVIAMAILAAIVVPVCSSLLLSLRMNAKAEAVLQARLTVSSAVETLMAEGITTENDAYDMVDGTDQFPGVKVVTKQDEEASYYNVGDETPTYYIVEVTDDDDLVTVTTCIRAVESTVIGEEEAG